MKTTFSVFLAVLDEFLLTSVQVWEKNSLIIIHVFVLMNLGQWS
jgi:hypothetical protein